MFEGTGLILFIGSGILVIMVGLVASVAFHYGEHEHLQKRMSKISGTDTKNKDKSGDPSQAIRKRQIQNKLKELEEAQKNLRKKGLKELLHQAGFTTSPSEFYTYSLIFGIVVTGLHILKYELGMMTIPVLLISIFVLPKWWLNKKIKKRQKQFTAIFADAIDIIVRGIKSGLPVGECISMIGREMAEPVGQEFRLITEGQKLGLPLDEILRRSLERMPTEELKFFSIVLSIQQQTGGNLADTLDKLSAVIRGRKAMRDKVQALSSEAKASAMIIGSLPFALAGILSLVAPDYIGLLFEYQLGTYMMMGGALWMTIGVLVMKKMINFDF